MTGRERLTNIFNCRLKDRVGWTTLVDDYTRSVMPEEIRRMNVMDFYRYIGCDILQFGNYGFEDSPDAVKYPFKIISPDIIRNERYFDENGYEVKKTKTRWGELTGIYKRIHPVKYPVQTIEDLRILSKIWAGTSCVFNDEGSDASYSKMESMIGESGIFVPTAEASPIQSLLEFEMGPENFYYLWADHKEEIDELLSFMNNVKLEEYRIYAEKVPYNVCIPLENTSTSYISPSIYEEYCVPFMSEFTNIMHRNGKKSVVHMCGLVNNLLPLIKETGMDGIHALTPSPIGDTDFNRALDILGEKLIIIGCLDSAVFQSASATADDIKALLKKTITPRIREANYILWAVADGLPTPVEKFLAIRDWMEDNF